MPCLKMGKIEQVRTDEQMPFTFDSSLGTLRMPDGSIRFFETDLGTKPYYFLYRGTPEDPLAEREGTFEIDYNGYADNWPSGIWVMGIVEHAGIWIGVCHREHFLHFGEENPNARVFNFYIGFAISQDAGLHWKYIGDVCSNVKNNCGIEPNMGGCPTLKVGKWLQFFFNDYQRSGKRYISSARCDLDECAAALKKGILPRVFKYTRDNQFNTDAQLGVGTMIIPESDTPGYDAHSNAAYCAPLKKYLITVQTHGLGKLLMYQSDDAVHWEQPIVVQQVEPGSIMQPYSTFVAISTDDSTDDMTTVGREFYLYWPLKGTGNSYDHDTWYRRKFTVE